MEKEKDEFELLTMSEWFDKEIQKNGDAAVLSLFALMDITSKD